MNQTLDKQAILAHYQSELQSHIGAAKVAHKPFETIVFAATSSDKRVIDLVAQFNACDERGRVTLMRMAQVMPKNDSTKEICK